MKPEFAREMLRVAWDEVKAHALRSSVTLVSVGSAVAAVIFLGSLARSGTASLKRGIEDIGGARLVAVFPKTSDRTRKGFGRPLSFEDAQVIRNRVAHVEQVAAIVPLGQRLVRLGNGAPKAADVLAGNTDMLSAFRMPLVAGRDLSQEDLERQQPVAILGRDVWSALFDSAADAIGKTVRIGPRAYRVVGAVDQIKRFGAGLGFDWNAFALVPATLSAQPPRALLILTEGVAFHTDVLSATQHLLDALHGYADDVEVFDFGKMVESFFAVFRILEWVVALLAGIALVVAAFGIVNAQLASLRQRIVDYGIRLALGAPRTALGFQMLFESTLLSGSGAAAGVGPGIGAAWLAGVLISRSHPGWVPVLAYDMAVGATVAAVLVGAFAGLLPARKAVRLNVVECLRAAS
jgi:putative ABC transport system permease protein